MCTGSNVSRIRPVRARQALTKVSDRALERMWCSRLDHRTIWHKTMFDRRVPGRTPPRGHRVRHDPRALSRPVRIPRRDPGVEAAVVRGRRRGLRDLGDDARRSARTLRAPPEKVVVTYLGVTVVDPAPGPLPFPESPWILYVGDRGKPYKNWTRLLDAVAALGPRARLACFGPPASPDEHGAIVARHLTGRVRFIGGDDHDLARIYRAASLLVYPSRFEGFGLPPLEAMAHGCPVVAARAGALPEILGDAAFLDFDPMDTDALAGAISVVLDDGERAASLRSGRRSRARPPTPGTVRWPPPWTATRWFRAEVPRRANGYARSLSRCSTWSANPTSSGPNTQTSKYATGRPGPTSAAIVGTSDAQRTRRARPPTLPCSRRTARGGTRVWPADRARHGGRCRQHAAAIAGSNSRNTTG